MEESKLKGDSSLQTVVNRIETLNIEDKDANVKSDYDDIANQDYEYTGFMERKIEYCYDEIHNSALNTASYEIVTCHDYTNAIEVASRLLSKGFTEKAKGLYQKIILSSPCEAFANLARAQLHVYNQDWDKALECYEHALNDIPDNVDLLYNRAYALHKQKRWEEALVAYDCVLKIQDDNDYCYLNKGIIYDHLEHDEEALSCYEMALLINPGLYHAWEFQGNIFFSQRKYDEALECFENAFDIEPGCLSALTSQADTLSMLERWEEAIDIYERVLAINPNSWQVCADKARALSKVGRFKAAAVGFKKALALHPVCSDTWIRFGVTLSRMGFVETAITLYDKAIRLKPSYFLPWKNKGAAFFEIEKYYESDISFNTSLSLAPTVPEIWYNKALLSIQNGKLKNAYQMLQYALKCDNHEDVDFEKAKAEIEETSLNCNSALDKLVCLDFSTSLRSPGHPADKLRFSLMCDFAIENSTL